MTKKTRNLLYGLTGLIVVILITSPRLSIFGDQDSPGTSRQVMDLRLPVSVHLVKPERVEDKIRSTGTVLANEEVALRSEIAGIIRQINFTEGGRVRKGGLLVKIDDSELRAQLQKLESQERLARDVETRRRTLYDNSLISVEEYDRAQNELASITADIALTKARINKTEIRAPFDGVVGLRYVSEGSYVTSTTHIATLQNLTSVKVDFSIPERYVNDVRAGQKIQFRLTGIAGMYAGEIFAVEPKIDPTTRTVMLRALSANEEGKILPGAFAEIDFVLRQTDNALMVPTEALVPQLGGQIVFCVQNGEAQPRQVTTGIRTERMIQITTGLQAGDSVITSGILQLRPGTPVRPAEGGA
jgi:membrane fusion protein (multidrug efflux system)